MPDPAIDPPFVFADNDEGMLRQAHDLLRFGVDRWRNSTFAFVASDLVDRLAARLPGAADVVETSDE